MSKPKVVVTRQLISEAQQLIDAKKEQFEIVQWDAETVRDPIDRPQSL
jgi:glyoxylate/hydroxypyruvate reductase